MTIGDKIKKRRFYLKKSQF